MSKQKTITIVRIAQEHLHLETLDTRRSDSLDFSDQAVWCIKAALEAAYEAGIEAGKAPETYLVEYAYPSSPLANKLGFAREGCWYVSALVKGKTALPRRMVTKGIADETIAQQICDELARRKS